MTMKPTPGPWQHGHFGTEALWIGPDYNQTPVAHVDHDMEYARDNSRANARLIAAAPCLLAALEALLPELDIEIETRQFGGNAEDWTDLEHLTENARAAIARARGESGQ